MRASSSTAWTARRSTGSTACRRRSRSTRPTRCAARARTVGTMTELNDHLKLLFARAAELFDQPDRAARAARLAGDDLRRADGAHRRDGDPRLVVTFPVELPANTSAEEVEQWLAASGFTRVQAEREVASPTGPRKLLDVVADRFRIQGTEKVRAVEAIETALKRGGGRVNVYVVAEPGAPRSESAPRDTAGGAVADARRCRGRSRRAPGRRVALLDRPALPRQRPALRRPAAGAVQLQLGLRRLRDLPRFRPRDRRRLRPGDSRPAQDAALRRHQADADAGLEGMPGRPASSTAARPASRATPRGRC